MPGTSPHLDRRLLRQVLALRDDGDDDHQRHAHQHAGHEAAEEEIADRGIGHHGVEDHGDRGRDDGADGRRGGGQRAGEARLIAALLQHHLDHQLARAGRIGDGAAAHAREDHAGDDGHMGEAAADAPDDQAGEAQQPLADGARVHDLGGDDEERHGEQHEAAEQAVQRLRRPPARYPDGSPADRERPRPAWRSRWACPWPPTGRNCRASARLRSSSGGHQMLLRHSRPSRR